MARLMRTLVCKSCNTVFSLQPGKLFKCVKCGSRKVKDQSLVPEKAVIKVFMLYESKKCRNCGRVLTHPTSIARGFGPSCAVLFAEKWLEKFPADLGERAKKRWTPEEIKGLIDFARSKRGLLS